MKDFATKYGYGKIITIKAEWINNTEKELLIIEEGPNEEIDIDAQLKTFINA